MGANKGKQKTMNKKIWNPGAFFPWYMGGHLVVTKFTLVNTVHYGNNLVSN